MPEKISAARPRGTDGAKVIQVIETKSIVGAGVPDDPVRLITQYWDFDGNKLAERDGYHESTGSAITTARNDA